MGWAKKLNLLLRVSGTTYQSLLSWLGSCHDTCISIFINFLIFRASYHLPTCRANTVNLPRCMMIYWSGVCICLTLQERLFRINNCNGFFMFYSMLNSNNLICPIGTWASPTRPSFNKSVHSSPLRNRNLRRSVIFYLFSCCIDMVSWRIGFINYSSFLFYSSSAIHSSIVSTKFLRVEDSSRFWPIILRSAWKLSLNYSSTKFFLLFSWKISKNSVATR